MKIGCISYCFHQQAVPVVADQLRQIGYRNIELWFGHPDGIADYHSQAEEDARHTSDVLKAHGLSPQAYCIGGWSAGDAPVMDRAFRFARGLGVDVITGCAQPAIMEEVDRLCSLFQIRFAIENHFGNDYEAPEDYRKTLRDRSHYIGVNFDTGHFAMAGADVPSAAETLSGRIYHVHLKDVTEAGAGGETCAFGRGIANIAGVLKTLKRQGYAGHLSVEHEVARDPTGELRECLEFVRQHGG